jgi:hypothetical protein
MQRYFSRAISGAGAGIDQESRLASAEMEKILTLAP